jgi:hypothetical protein
VVEAARSYAKFAADKTPPHLRFSEVLVAH